jgi:hydrogenase/urease accessory protein HupE
MTRGQKLGRCLLAIGVGLVGAGMLFALLVCVFHPYEGLFEGYAHGTDLEHLIILGMAALGFVGLARTTLSASEGTGGAPSA